MLKTEEVYNFQATYRIFVNAEETSQAFSSKNNSFLNRWAAKKGNLFEVTARQPPVKA